MSQQTRPSDQPLTPPTPRDLNLPSESELIPIRSAKINIWKSGILIPAAVTALACVLLFTISNFYQIMYVFSAYLLFAIFYAAYAYSGSVKPFFAFLVPFAILYFELTTPVLGAFIYVFRHILPGDTPKDAGFVGTFVTMFFGAGLMEELMKAVPALIGLQLALRSSPPTTDLKGRLVDALTVRTPLDGIMIGLAAGAAFIYVETLYQYVPNTVTQVAKTHGAGSGFANGFALLFPRVLHGVVGHMAWAGISGYFIGLAARYPGSLVKLLAIGWLAPSLLHAFWNSSSHIGQAGMYLSAAASLVVFVACLLKAKQLELVQAGGRHAPTDSIVIGAPASASAPGTGTSAATGLMAALSGLSGSLFGRMSAATAAAPAAEPAAQTPAAPAPSAPAAAPRFILACAGQRYGILPGQTIDLATLFPAQGLAPGSHAVVSVHPQDATAIGLKNLTQETWAAVLESGASTNVPPGRHLKLVAGEKIRIGAVTIEVEAV